MDWLGLDPGNCSIQRTLALIGEKWTLLVIRDAANGVRRFDDFHRHVGLSERVLADRLRTLVDAGILQTRPYRVPGQRERIEYRMTARGWELYPVLIGLLQWGDRHLADPQGPAWSVSHADCGHPVEAVVRCSHDHAVLEPRDSVSQPGPAARMRADA